VRALGLDGFNRGWVAVLLDGDEQAVSFHSCVGDALSVSFDRAAIDIPIGLTDDGERACDLLARERLRPHTSRVFTGARRWLWQEFDDPDRANRKALQRSQKRVSRQLWHLGPKIMEVDAFRRAYRSRDVREVHPELVFLRLNDGAPLPPKKSEEGDFRRRALLRRAGFREVERWLNHDRISTGAKRDDVLDACAAAVAAREPTGRLPEGEPPLDRYGLPMQIWY
jgi:predicted RNase H-like nuclease